MTQSSSLITRYLACAACALLCGMVWAQEDAAKKAAAEKEVSALNHETDKLVMEGRYQEALALANKAIALAGNELGSESADLAAALHRAALLYRKMDDNAKAEPLCRRALEIRRKTLGENHPRYAESLQSLAGFYLSTGRYAEAEPLYREALEIRRKALGEDNSSYASNLSCLGGLYHKMGEYAKAEPLYRQAMEIRRKTLGEEHPHYATSLHSLAALYASMGRYAEAEPLYRQALEIRRKTLGEAHPDYAVSLSTLAGLYEFMGRYAEAEPLLRQALEIRRKALGENHRDYATSLSNLARLYTSIGRYAEAERFYREAVEIYHKKASGQEDPDYAKRLDGLAWFYECLGRYAEAEPLYRQAMEVRRETLGEEDLGYARSLYLLAALYESMGRYAETEQLCRQALEINRKVRGEEHPSYAWSLNSLAAFYCDMGRYAEAEPLRRQAMEIRCKTLGEEHPYYADSLNNLAVVYYGMGRYAEAEQLYRQALDIYKEVFGEEHPSYAMSLSNLAWVLAVKGAYDEALDPMLRCLAMKLKTLSRVFTISSERDKMAFVRMVRPRVDTLQGLVACSLASSPSARRSALELLLQTQAIVLEAVAGEQQAVLQNPDPQARAKFDQLRQTCERLASLTLSGPGKMPVAAYRSEIERLKKEQDELEADLARLSKEFSLEKAMRNVTLEAVQRDMPEDSVLIVFCCPHIFDFKATGKQPQWLPAHYLTYVLTKTAEAPELLDLGEAEAIDKAIAEFRSTAQEPGSDSASASKRLYDLVFSPLSSLIPQSSSLSPQSSSLLISPDGALSLVPFEALWDGKDYLLNRYKISYLDAGRDVVRFAQREKSSGDVVVLCDPDYDLGADARAQALKQTEKPTELAALDTTRRSSDEAMRGLRFKRLPGTREEGDALAKLMEAKQMAVKRYEGSQALEEVLKGLKGPRVLHLATHGFFLEDKFEDALRKASPERGIAGLSSGPEEEQDAPHLPIENPLLRSGLALAGANRFAEAKSGMEDGIATALELSRLDLTNTELVVLSACDTGVGQIKVGEGVFGLRRAIQHAGARSIVMSLWKVEDRATRLFMERFYTNWLGGMSKSDALREAKLWMAGGQVESKGTEGRGIAAIVPSMKEGEGAPSPSAAPAQYSHPYYWAPFVLVGDWR